MALAAGPREHRLRVHLLHASHRNPGHCEVAAIRERDDEEGKPVRHWRDDNLLRVARVHRVRGLRQQRAGKRPYRLRQAVLARRRRQRRRGHPLGGSLSGVRAADIRVLREVAGEQVAGLGVLPQGVPAAPGLRPRGAVHDVQAGGAHGVRGRHHGGVADAALLQRRARAARRHRVLAAHGVLPGYHVHRPGEGDAREPQVGGAAGAQRRRARGFAARRRGIGGRHGAASGPRHHLPDAALKTSEFLIDACGQAWNIGTESSCFCAAWLCCFALLA